MPIIGPGGGHPMHLLAYVRVLSGLLHSNDDKCSGLLYLNDDKSMLEGRMLAIVAHQSYFQWPGKNIILALS